MRIGYCLFEPTIAGCQSARLLLGRDTEGGGGEGERLDAGVVRLLEEGEEAAEEEEEEEAASERDERRTGPDASQSYQCSSEQKFSPSRSTPVVRSIRQRAH
jgi:hypothetical protein